MSRPSQVTDFGPIEWTPDSDGIEEAAVHALERGDVLFFPDLAFSATEGERESFSPTVVRSAKQVSYDPSSGRVGGAVPDAEARRRLGGMLSRFSRQAAVFITGLCRRYCLNRAGIVLGRASFRPVEIA